MIGVIRHFIALLLVVVVSLGIVAVLLAGQYAASGRFDRLNEEFLNPAARQVDKARIALEAMRRQLLLERHVPDQRRAVPFHFMAQAAVDAVDTHLANIIRLNDANDFAGDFELPNRARAQLEAIAARLRAGGDLQSADGGPPRLLDPLRGTLDQLDRIYELEQASQREQFQASLAARTRAVLSTVVLLLLVAVPLVTVLALRLRRALRHEVRSRAELAEANENLSVLALHDELTGLANRHVFRTRLEQVASAARRSGRIAALMYIDLDDFKRINDSMGHDVGDEVLKAVGARLAATVRGSDTVARLGGDEFTVMLSDMSESDDAGAIAEKLLAGVSRPLPVADRSVVVHASIGITLVPADSDQPATLMKNADMAMYKAKEAGGNRFQFFVEAMNRAATERMSIEEELRNAVHDHAFELHYQPQVALSGGGITGVEALLRWRRKDGTLASPEVFIPVAEHTGLMPVIGDWVLTRACSDIAQSNARLSMQLGVSVNLSARQFRDPALVSRVEQALRRSALPPSLLELEITETTLVDDIDKAVTTLTTLRTLGVKVAIDDFGIGYSSLGYLRRLPVDTLKIDRSFVRDIESDQSDRTIVDTIVAMAQTMSLRVVAEGVETRWQLDHLDARRCDAAQGFLLCKPMPPTELRLADLDASLRKANRREVESPSPG